METKEVVNNVSDLINNMGFKNHEFIKEMSTDHRTLQQKFTKLCLEWIEFVASDEYRTDGRNEASHNVCKELMEGFKTLKEEQGYTSYTLDIMAKPSGYCSLI